MSKETDKSMGEISLLRKIKKDLHDINMILQDIESLLMEREEGRKK